MSYNMAYVPACKDDRAPRIDEGSVFALANVFTTPMAKR